MKKRKIIGLSLVLAISLGAAGFTKIQNDNYFDIVKNIEIFTHVFKTLNTNYADDIDPNSLMKIGIDAMVNSLDPYTVYYSESTIEKYRFQQEGKYSGLGGQFELVDGYVTIVDAVEKSPLIRSGFRIGDQLVNLEGTDLKGVSVSDFTKLLNTSDSESVNLQVQRTGQADLLSLTLREGEVKIDNVPYYTMVSDDVGYVILTTFTQNASANVKSAINKLKAENPEMKSLILDLRNNGGGLLNEAVNICNLFLPQGKLVVSTKGKVRERDQLYKTQAAPLDPDIPLAVLINGSSASASEIVSGVMQDYDRAVLIGQESFGKGLVQLTRKLVYNSQLKVTISKYYIPSERCIQGVEYADGKPVDIPDSLRSEFKTSNGRIVRDGGGVQPDIVMAESLESELLGALNKQHWILKYVNQYVAGQDSISAPQSFEWNDMTDFYNFLDQEGFSYVHSHEKALTKLRETKVNDTEAVHLDEALSSIAAYKKSLRQSDSEAIRKSIEEQIVSRYHYDAGKVQIALRNDDDVQKAIDVLNDQVTYNDILGKQ